MAISEPDLEQIGSYVKTHLVGWLDQIFPRRESDIPLQLLERMVRVEEELKAQRELMTVRFDAVDRRFESVDQRFEAVDRRFESMDQRFEDLIGYMNGRFEAVDKRFSTIQWIMGIGFVMMGTLVTVFGVLA